MQINEKPFMLKKSIMNERDQGQTIDFRGEHNPQQGVEGPSDRAAETCGSIQDKWSDM
jgi:hypothetical protein